jgi:hypothetical protein
LSARSIRWRGGNIVGGGSLSAGAGAHTDRMSSMNTVTKLTAIATILASTSSWAMAQSDVGAGAGANVGVDAGGASVGTGVDANANAGGNNGNAGANVNASTQAGANNSANANANAGANAAGNAEVNYGSIISSLRTSTVTGADIEALGADAQIDIVTLAELQGNAAENSAALGEAVSAQATSLAELTAAIEANADVQAALTAEGFTSDQIVAVTSSGEGNLTIVVDDTK